MTVPTIRTVLLRADATARGGIGHLTRCLAVADAARSAGWGVLLSAALETELSQRLVATAAGVEHLPPADDVALLELARARGAQVVHVDDYLLRSPTPGAAAEQGVTTSSVQDGRWGRRDAHVVLDATPDGHVRAAVLPSAQIRLTGIGQSLVRSRVHDAAAARAVTTPSGVLVVAGGSDAVGLTDTLTDLVASLASPRRQVTVIDPGSRWGTKSRRSGRSCGAARSLTCPHWPRRRNSWSRRRGRRCGSSRSSAPP